MKFKVFCENQIGDRAVHVECDRFDIAQTVAEELSIKHFPLKWGILGDNGEMLEMYMCGSLVEDAQKSSG